MIFDARQRRIHGSQWPLGPYMLAICLCAAIAPSSTLAATAQENGELAARRARIASLSPADQAELARKFERFQQLSSDEQAQLRGLHERIEADPETDELRAVMDRYQQWLTDLLPGERAELLALEPTKRVAWIRNQRKSERERLARWIDPADRRAVLRWLYAYVEENEEQLVAHMPPHHARWFTESKVAKHRLAVMVTHRLERPPQDRGSIMPTAEDFQKIYDAVTPLARQKLAEVQAPVEKRRVVAHWIHTAFRAYTEQQRSRQPPEIEPHELAEFFDSLDVAERDRLLDMPADEMQREISRMYIISQSRDAGEGPGGPRKPPPGFDKPNRRGPSPGGRPPRDPS